MSEVARSSRSSADRRLSALRRSVARLLPFVRPWRVIGIALGSTSAGLAEAGVLALVAHIATAMSRATQSVAVSLGPIDLNGPTSALLVMAAVLASVRLLLQLVVVRMPARLSGEVQSRLRTQLFGAFLRASWSAKADEREGHLQELMGSQTGQVGVAVVQLIHGFSAALMFLALATSAFLVSPAVAGAVMGATALVFAGLRPLSGHVRRRSAAASEAAVEQASGIVEAVRMAEEVQVFGVAEAVRSRVESLVRSLEKHFVRTRTLSDTVPILYQGAVILLLVAGLGLIYAMGTGRMATLGAVVLLLVRAAAYGQQVQSAYQGLGEALPYLDRLTDVIGQYRASAPHGGDRTIGPIETLEFESVSFWYRPGTPVLRDVSFRIDRGESVGLVGPSGAGKSTLLQILLRLREPISGVFRTNGVPASDVDDVTWQGRVAYVPQEPQLLRGTVAENIRFHRDWVDDDAVERAARLAHIHDDITTWVDGYRTVIGQRADAVSGGQRQRLCLARALAGAPELLVLDEPTSSLDLESEQLIQRSLKELRGSLTLVVVAHRMTTLNLCDRVMVIRDGRLEAFAPRGVLYGSNDFYRRAVDLAGLRGPL